MFYEIFRFEFTQWMKKPFPYISFVGILGFSLLIIAESAGLFGGVNDSNEVINSNIAIADFITVMSMQTFIPVFLIVAIMAPAVFKDFQYNMHGMLFTKPISKPGYLGGRFLATFLVSVFVMSSIPLGHYIGCTFFNIEASYLGPFALSNYLQPFFYLVVPNILFIGLLFFAVATFTRNMVAAYVSCLILIIAQITANSIGSELKHEYFAALLEPFGQNALSLATKFWTPSEKNTSALPFDGVLLYNRLIWLGVSIGIAILIYFKFAFSQSTAPFTLFNRKAKEDGSALSSGAVVRSLSEIPKAAQSFTTAFNWKQLAYLSKFEFINVVKSPFALIIAVMAVLGFTTQAQYLGAQMGTPTYMVTYKMLEQSGGFYVFFALILIIFFSGAMAWRERDARTEELVGASPIPNWVLVFSKIGGLTLAMVAFLFLLMFNSIVLQLFNGFTDINLGHYIVDLFGFTLLHFLIYILFAFFVHTVIPNRYVGYIVIVIFWLFLPMGLRKLEWANNLLYFNSSGPGLRYSDMNGYGHKLVSYIPFKLYWLGFCGVLVTVATLIWMRGKETALKSRLAMAKRSFGKGQAFALILSFVVFAGFGSYIYYNTSVLNTIYSNEDWQKIQVDYEKKYKQYEAIAQPKITAVQVAVDIFPERRAVDIQGSYQLLNKSERQVDSIFIGLFDDVKLKSLIFDIGANLLMEDTKHNYFLYKLDKSLMPGDSTLMTFSVSTAPKGFKNDDAGISIVENGTFFDNYYLPSLGYNNRYELSDNRARKKYGLEPKDRVAKYNDTLAWNTKFIGGSADWISLDATVSTSSDQIAIAPGKLQKSWEENGRKYYHYKTETPVNHFFSFVSARYEVRRDKWKDVDIEIFYHKGHEYNLDRMMRGIKGSLEYCSAYFGPYPHSQVRILEYPRYRSFAQSFPNTIPFSEGIGFISKVDTTIAETVDLPFFVTAHEMGHQWWANQVVPAKVQGFNVLSESLAEYSALMVMERAYGREGIQKFMKYEMDTYLQGRTSENRGEQPLIYDEGTQYAVYNKGGVVFYALKDYLGEDVLNGVLSDFIKKYGQKDPPYPTARELADNIKAVTPDSLKYIITDLLETITLYENKTELVTIDSLPGGKYKVSIDISCQKFRADSLGKSSEIPIADYIDVGVFAEKEINGKKSDKVLYMQKHKFTEPNTILEIVVDEKPYKAGIDPYNKLIDRKPDDNTRKVGEPRRGKSDKKKNQVEVKVEAN